ncbi:hypothetical protein TIFTF001_002581 [Ficus carica]|uniref:TF-B3 domain-containing protein n=1 Tax=Ficus carica TaxID=3494 RepID=A0AA88CPR1_FICCA|nr:hypothetical protein TIFTF001_002581 [Ficus carica]
MAPHGQRFSPVNLHFRKRVSPNTLLDDKLRIPRDIMKKYGATISDPVVIEVPSGTQWEMGLREYNGDIWLAKGWPEFVQHHSLENGQALFFKYKVQSDEEEPKPRVSLSVDERDKALSRTKDFNYPIPHCKVVIQKGNLHDSYDLVLPKDFWLEHLYDKTGDVESQKYKNVFDDATLYVSRGRTWTVMLNVSAVGTKSVRVSFLKRGWKEFAEDNNLKVGDVCIFELISKNEMIFKVTINREGDYQNSQQSLADKSEVNQDQPKTIRRFKRPSTPYKDETTCNMQSIIDHTAEEEYKCRRLGEIDVEAGKELEYESFNLGTISKNNQVTKMPPALTNPCFKVELPVSCARNLHVPKNFAAKYFLPETQIVKLKVGKEMWEVKMLSFSGRYVFSGGWSAFATANNLWRGMFCSFELVGREHGHVQFKVTISEPATSSSS